MWFLLMQVADFHPTVREPGAAMSHLGHRVRTARLKMNIQDANLLSLNERDT